MSKSKDKLNGSVDALASAFRDVIIDAVSPLSDKIDEVNKNLGDRIGDRLGSDLPT